MGKTSGNCCDSWSFSHLSRTYRKGAEMTDPSDFVLSVFASLCILLSVSDKGWPSRNRPCSYADCPRVRCSATSPHFFLFGVRMALSRLLVDLFFFFGVPLYASVMKTKPSFLGWGRERGRNLTFFLTFFFAFLETRSLLLLLRMGRAVPLVQALAYISSLGANFRLVFCSFFAWNVYIF